MLFQYQDIVCEICSSSELGFSMSTSVFPLELYF
jgi:hypothetical protein